MKWSPPPHSSWKPYRSSGPFENHIKMYQTKVIIRRRSPPSHSPWKPHQNFQNKRNLHEMISTLTFPLKAISKFPKQRQSSWHDLHPHIPLEKHIKSTFSKQKKSIIMKWSPPSHSPWKPYQSFQNTRNHHEMISALTFHGKRITNTLRHGQLEALRLGLLQNFVFPNAALFLQYIKTQIRKT